MAKATFRTLNCNAPKLFLTFFAYLLIAAFGSPLAFGATIAVTDMVDANSGVVSCTLRDAITSVNNGSDTFGCIAIGVYGTADTINVPAGTYTITLPGVENNNASGDFDIGTTVTITGAGATTTIIQAGTLGYPDPGANGIDRVFDVTAAVATTFDNLTIRNGNVNGSGAGIFSLGELTLNNSIVSGNKTTVNTGGIFVFGLLTLNNSTVSGNVAGSNYAGIYSASEVNLTDSTVSGNTAGLNYGGIYASGALTLTNSAVSGNTATGVYGGIYALGAATLTNSAVSGNTATGSYGGIYARGDLTLTGSTVSNNSAGASFGGITGNNLVTIVNSTVNNNTAGDSNGGVSGGAVTLTNSTVSGNSAGRDYGGIYSNSTVGLTNSTLSGNTATRNYGGIYASGALTVTGSTVSNNSAGAYFGGINSNNAVTITNSTISNNTAVDSNGGVSGGAVTLTNSTVSGNSAGGDFGGIFSNGALTMDSSTISGNMAGSSVGGAIGNVVTIANSTISGNTAGGVYGGIVAQGMTTLTNTTIYGNSGTFVGSGLYIFNGTATLSNTIVANNPGGDCHAVASTWTSNGFNIDSDGTCLALGVGIGDFTSIGFILPTLAFNGGTTMTHALLTGSQAIDTGSCVTATDQIGTVRPQGAGCDIGAYEAIQGCTDPAATNYNPSATVDDGSCTYPPHKPRNHSPYDPNGGGAEWLIYPGADETSVNPGTAFKWYELADDDGDPITYDPQFCDGFESGECTSWSSVNGRVTTLRQAQGDKLGGAATASGALIFALGFIGAIRTRRGRAFMLALLLMTSGAMITACGSDSSDDGSSSSAAITCDNVEDGVICQTQAGLAANTEYTWRVVASDGKGGENISVIRSFATGE